MTEKTKVAALRRETDDACLQLQRAVGRLLDEVEALQSRMHEAATPSPPVRMPSTIADPAEPLPSTAAVLRDPLLTVAQAGQHLGKSRAWMWRLIKTDALKSVKIGAARRIRQSDLEAYIAGLAPSVPNGTRRNYR